MASSPPDRQLPGFSFLLAEKTDFDAAIAQLTAKGVKARRCDEVHPGLRIQDPDGHNIDFYSR